MKKSSTQAKNIVSANFSDKINVQVDPAADYSFVQVNEFQPNVSGWNRFGNVSEYSKVDDRTILLKNAQQLAIQVTFISNQGLRVQFRPETNPDYSQRNDSYAVVNNKSSVSGNLKISEIDKNGPTLKVESESLTLYIGLQPYGMAIYQDDVLVSEDCFGKNIIYSHEAVACLREAPENENYYGFGQKAGSQLNKKNFTMSCFNYDNFSYEGSNVIPDGNQPGPLNPSEPLYNSIPFMLAVGNHDQQLYSYGLFLDNVSQSYFNMGSNDYSDMTGKYYFGALYGDLDYYILIGEQKTDGNPIRSVLNQYSELTGRSAMPPKYALGYQQGCYGYYDRDILMGIAKAYRDAAIPIDGLHIDVDFQNNYRTFTSSPKKFPNPKDMFYQLHKEGFKCSTNITGIISANPLDEDGNRDTPYAARDSFVSINDNNTIAIKKSKGIPFLYNTRSNAGESPDLFIANESYGLNNGFNPFKYPTPLYPNGQNALGTYGFYCDLGQQKVQDWWGKQYDYLLDIGIDMVWQDMTAPSGCSEF